MWSFSWKKSNTWTTLLIRMVEGQNLNELLQLKTCRHPIISLHCRVSSDYRIITRYSYLRALPQWIIKKSKPWVWTAECLGAFEKIKKKLTTDLFHTHYNPDLDIIVASGTSSYGVWGAFCTKWLMRQLNR